MSYPVYTTDALVCSSVFSNGSDRFYQLFTERFGMLYASARGVRKESSRQRFAMQDFSLVRVSLIKGRMGWIVGSVESNGNVFLNCDKRHNRVTVINIVRLLRRYVQGEQVLSRIYKDACVSLKTATKNSVRVCKQLEDVFQVRMLADLGYVDTKTLIKDIVESNDFNVAFSYYNKEEHAHLIESIMDEVPILSHL